MKLIRWVGNPQTCKGMAPQVHWDFDDYEQAAAQRKRDMAATGLPFDHYTID